MPGWRLSHGEGAGRVLRARLRAGAGAGPHGAAVREARAMATRPTSATLVLEGDRPPPPPIVAKVAQRLPARARAADLHLRADAKPRRRRADRRARRSKSRCTRRMSWTFRSIASSTASGRRRCPPPHPDFVTAMGRTNDAIIYAGRVQLFVTGPAAEARALAEQLAEQDIARLRPAVRRNFQAASRAISTRSIRCCSARPRSSSRRSRPARASTPAASTAACSMRPSPERVARGSRGRAAASSRSWSTGCDWHARELARALQALGVARRPDPAARLRLRHAERHSGSNSRLRRCAACPTPCWCARCRAARFEAVTLRLGVLHALARTRRAGLERRARHRALRRQVDDQLPAGARRHPDAADLDGANRREAARAIVRRETSRRRRWC